MTMTTQLNSFTTFCNPSIDMLQVYDYDNRFVPPKIKVFVRCFWYGRFWEKKRWNKSMSSRETKISLEASKDLLTTIV